MVLLQCSCWDKFCLGKRAAFRWFQAFNAPQVWLIGAEGTSKELLNTMNRLDLTSGVEMFKSKSIKRRALSNGPKQLLAFSSWLVPQSASKEDIVVIFETGFES